MAPYDSEACHERHRRLDEYAERNAQNIDRLFGMNNKLLWAVITCMGIILVAICGVLWTQVQLRGDLQESSQTAERGFRQIHADAGSAHIDSLRDRKE